MFFVFCLKHFWVHSLSIGVFAISLIFVGMMCYVLSYVDPATTRGNRNWEWFRRLKMWRFLWSWWFPISYHWQYHRFQMNTKYVFIVHPNPYNLGMLMGLGLHGDQETMTSLNLLWMAPRILLKIPGLRDLLLWSGAVDHDQGNLVDLMNRGHSVALCPNGMKDALMIEEDSICITKARREIFSFACEMGAELVPVLIYGEAELYDCKSWGPLDYFRVISLNKIGVPWPTIATGHMKTFLPKRRELHVYIGSPTEALGKQPDAVMDEFYRSLETLNCTDLDKPIKYI
jgi:hypothetical protein